MSTASDTLISSASDYYFKKLVDRTIYNLARLSQGLRQNPDNALKDLWEDLCVQQQSERWDEWYLLEAFVQVECEKAFAEQPLVVQQILSFEFLESEEIVVREDDVSDKLMDSVFQAASTFTNRRIKRYLDSA